jgi:hypothetical protein
VHCVVVATVAEAVLVVPRGTRGRERREVLVLVVCVAACIINRFAAAALVGQPLCPSSAAKA